MTIDKKECLKCAFINMCPSHKISKEDKKEITKRMFDENVKDEVEKISKSNSKAIVFIDFDKEQSLILASNISKNDIKMAMIYNVSNLIKEDE